MKTRRMDYHVHTLFSYDGEQSVDEMCRRMLDLGVEEVCLTEHLDLGHPDEECQGIPAWDIWEREIRYCSQKYPMLKIRRGIEVGDKAECREEIKKYVAAYAWDYILLSLHLVDNVDPYNKDVFFQGKDRKACYARYLETIVDTVTHYDDFDTLAHIGYISRYAPWSDEEKPVRYEDYRDAVDCILRSLIERGKCLEINTKGYTEDTFVPDESIIRRYLALGGELFTFGSDGHTTIQDYHLVETAKARVRELGGKYQVAFHGRKPEIYLI